MRMSGAPPGLARTTASATARPAFFHQPDARRSPATIARRSASAISAVGAIRSSPSGAFLVPRHYRGGPHRQRSGLLGPLTTRRAGCLIVVQGASRRRRPVPQSSASPWKTRYFRHFRPCQPWHGPCYRTNELPSRFRTAPEVTAMKKYRGHHQAFQPRQVKELCRRSACRASR